MMARARPESLGYWTFAAIGAAAVLFIVGYFLGLYS